MVRNTAEMDSSKKFQKTGEPASCNTKNLKEPTTKDIEIIQGDQNVPDENENPDEVFKPKKSTPRTPPNRMQDDTLHDMPLMEKNFQETNKRHRSESSPEAGKINKRACYEMQNIITDKVISNFFEEIDQINKVVNRDFKQLPFSNGDKSTIINSSINIHKLLTQVVLKVSNLEKENFALSAKLLEIENGSTKAETSEGVRGLSESTKADSDKPSVKAKSSYADIAKEQHGDQSRKYNSKQDTQWTTPPTNRKIETLVRINEINDPEIVVGRLKREVQSKDTDGGFRNIRKLKSGTVIIESHSKVQQEKLRNLLREKSDISLKEIQATDPMFMITGIEKGYTDNDFVKELVRLNSEIRKEISCTIEENIKVIAKKQCRNPTKENWILQAKPDIAKWFLKKQLVNFDLLKVHVEEHINLAVCFKCCGFGHVAKYCKQDECCHRCAGCHSAKECKEESLKCVNCLKMKYTDIAHSARDVNCPVYKLRINRFRNNINYQTDFL
nr:unnamed protein product [Callosobruchus chinensis]